VVVARYNVDENTQGLIGVVGPTRMDYSKVAAALAYVAQAIGLMLSGNDFKLPKLPENVDNNAKEN
jgi:heat-inducible transcriptional repressor